MEGRCEGGENTSIHGPDRTGVSSLGDGRRLTGCCGTRERYAVGDDWAGLYLISDSATGGPHSFWNRAGRGARGYRWRAELLPAVHDGIRRVLLGELEK
jgi:hypothetical protein